MAASKRLRETEGLNLPISGFYLNFEEGPRPGRETRDAAKAASRRGKPARAHIRRAGEDAAEPFRRAPCARRGHVGGRHQRAGAGIAVRVAPLDRAGAVAAHAGRREIGPGLGAGSG
jgi:hypothetical protein